MLIFRLGGAVRVLGRPSVFRSDVNRPRYTSVEQLKKQLNVAFSDDDDYMEGLLASAERTIENYIQRPFSEVAEEDELPAPLLMAVLILASGLYSNREPVAYATPMPVPYNLSFLIQPYIKYR